MMSGGILLIDTPIGKVICACGCGRPFTPLTNKSKYYSLGCSERAKKIGNLRRARNRAAFKKTREKSL